MMQETLFLASINAEWGMKRCFCAQTIRSKELNNVYSLFHKKISTPHYKDFNN